MARYLLVRRSAIPFDVIVNFDSGSEDSTLGVSEMNASTHGTTIPGTWSTPDAITHTTFHTPDFTLPYPLLVDGVTYDGSTGKGLRFNQEDDAIDDDIFAYTFSGSVKNLIWLLLIQWDLDNAVTADYNNDIVGIEWGQFAVAQMGFSQSGSPSIGMRIHASTAASGALAYTMGQKVLLTAKLTEDGEFWLCMQDAETEEVLSATFAQLGTPPTDFVLLHLQDYLRVAASPNGWTGNIYAKTFAMRASDLTFPVRALTVPPAAAQSAVQTVVDTVVLSFTSVVQAWLLERDLNSGGYATITSPTLELFGGVWSYSDTDVSDGDVVQYRITAVIDSASSTSVTSNSVTVDNSTAPLAIDDFDDYGGTFLGQSATASATYWEEIIASVNVTSGGKAFGSGGGTARHKAAFTSDQRSEVTVAGLVGGSSRFAGVVVRCDAVGIFYGFITDGSQYYVYDTIGGFHVIASGTRSIANGDKIDLAAVGASTAARVTARHYASGSWTTVVSSADPGASHYFDGGKPGVVGSDGSGTLATMDDWKGFNL